MPRQINPGGGLGTPYFVQEGAVDSVGNVPEEAVSTFTKLAPFYGSTPFGNASIGFVNVMHATSTLSRESARDNMFSEADVDYYYLGFLPRDEVHRFYLITADYQTTSFTEDRIGSTPGVGFQIYTREREARSVEFWPADIPDLSYAGFTGNVGERMTFSSNDGVHRRDDPERHEVYLKVYHYNSRGDETVYAVLYSLGEEIAQEDLRDIYERVVLLQQRYDETGSLGLNPGGDFHLPRAPDGVDSNAWRDLDSFLDRSWYAERFPDIDFPRGNPIGHFWDQWRAGVRVDPHPLFLTDHYLAQNPGLVDDGSNPVLDYLERWRSEPGLSPHPLFDANFYFNRHRDLLTGDQSPIQHYSMNWSTNSNLDPNPLFSTSFYIKNSPDLFGEGNNPLYHYWTYWQVEPSLNPHPLFESKNYIDRYADVSMAGINPLLHFVQFGGREGRIPHPIFDTGFYLGQNPDVAASGLNPLIHYLDHGGGEGRDPHALFSSAFYLERNPDIAAAGMNPLLHYILSGGHDGRNPHPLFDSAFYLVSHPDVAAAGVNPLVHYVQSGWQNGRNPHPVFDTGFYLGQNPDVAAAGVNPLIHYLQYGGQEGRNPHALFDSAFYLDANPDVAAAGVNPLAHYLLFGWQEGRNPLPLFDGSLYLERNPDVAAAGMNPLVHYLLYGGAEGRDPHPLFDSSFYLERNPDVAATGMNPVLHYLLYGAREGRDPGPAFDSSFYLETYPDIARSDWNPLAHYVLFGEAEGRKPLAPPVSAPTPIETPPATPPDFSDPGGPPDEHPGNPIVSPPANPEPTPPVDDYGDDAGSAEDVLIGSIVRGALEEVGDSDWFRVDLPSSWPDGRLYLAFERQPDGPPLSALEVTIYGENGTTQRHTARLSGESYLLGYSDIFFGATFSGPDSFVFLEISAPGGVTGDYRFGVRQTGTVGFITGETTDWPGSLTSASETFAPRPGDAQGFRGRFGEGDFVDAFRLELDTARNVDIKLTTSAVTPSIDVIPLSGTGARVTESWETRTRFVGNLEPGVYEIEAEYWTLYDPSQSYVLLINA